MKAHKKSLSDDVRPISHTIMEDLWMTDTHIDIYIYITIPFIETVDVCWNIKKGPSDQRLLYLKHFSIHVQRIGHQNLTSYTKHIRRVYRTTEQRDHNERSCPMSIKF